MKIKQDKLIFIKVFGTTLIRNIFLQKMPTPWLAILTSPAVWATSAAHFANNWGFYTMLTCLPTYMKDVLKFDIKSVSSCM